MKGISFYPAFFFIWLITLLPLPILFVFSDFLFVILFYLVRYRRKVVMKNLRNAFPERSPGEIRSLARRFYRHLTDSFIEAVYSLNMSEKEHSRRYVYKNPGLLDEYYMQNRNILLLISHYGNWEWLSSLPRFVKHTVLFIYKPLQNKLFDKFFLKLRQKYGIRGIPMGATLRVLAGHKQEKEPVILYSLADQRPQWKNTRYWCRFLNQDSAIFAGTEKLSRQFDMTVVFLKVRKLKRGAYEIEFVPLCEDPDRAAEFEITRKYFDTVESVIRQKPEHWLWSHNRWKYRRDPDRNPVDIDQILG
jgi:KDO2-lipid IV(A) lauroyltransferase